MPKKQKDLGKKHIMWMVRAGQPARGGEEPRMFLKTLKGVGCELDILGTLVWTDPI